jgi:hypothetical protein
MAEPTENDFFLSGMDAKKFLEYDKNPWKHETEESRKPIRAARDLVEKSKYCPHCGEYIRDRIL